VDLKVFKTLWGFSGSYKDAVKVAVEQGYDGIEGPVPETIKEAEQFSELLKKNNFHYISEVATTGSYVPDRKLTVKDHLDYLGDKLAYIKILQPDFITCLGGCDAWSESDSILFLREAIGMAAEIDMDISFETHRGRIFFNPWVTQAIVKKMPSLKLTCDFSHWCVVCEGLQETEEGIIQSLLPNVWHIHGRVGFDQGPQIPDPRTPLFINELEKHFKWWSWIWNEHYKQSRNITTVTPEFGPDGYEYFEPIEGKPLVDINDINMWMADNIRENFNFDDEEVEQIRREMK
jgi:hypothetical protein